MFAPINRSNICKISGYSAGLILMPENPRVLQETSAPVLKSKVNEQQKLPRAAGFIPRRCKISESQELLRLDYCPSESG